MAKRGKSRAPTAPPRRRTARRRARQPLPSKDKRNTVAALRRELSEARRQLSEALEQQTATSQVLQVISRSPGDLESVFRIMLENATRICAAQLGFLWLADGDGFRAVAMHGVPPALGAARPSHQVFRFEPESPLGRLALTKQLVHVADITEEPSYRKGFRPLVELADLFGARTLLLVPMLKEGEVIGSINIYRQEVRPFSDEQIDLMTNFARQAVIAIENARLLSDLRESLQQQTATADVLAVISASRFDVQPVFEAIIKRAAQLCQSVLSAIYRSDGELVHLVAHDQFSPESVAAVRAAYPVPVTSSNLIAVAIRERRAGHIPNVLLSGGYYRAATYVRVSKHSRGAHAARRCRDRRHRGHADRAATIPTDAGHPAGDFRQSGRHRD
jgi:hypothetical protein